MKMIVTEVENEGLEALIGQVVTLFCGVYIYSGKLVGVNDTCVKLEDAGIVYETGPFTVIIIVQIKSKVIGVVVDSVVDVVNLQQENLLEAPEESTELDSKFVKGLANLRGEMVILLDLEQLLAPDELEQLSMLR